MATADGKTPFYKKWWFWLIIVVVIIGIAGAPQKTDIANNLNDSRAGGDVAQVTEDNDQQPKTITEQDIEDECTDAKYGINEGGFNPIYITDYNFQTYDYGYDEQGNVITLAEWNGKKDGEKVIFHCYASGSNSDNIKVYWISADGVDLWKSELDLNQASYNEQGEPTYPDLH